MKLPTYLRHVGGTTMLIAAAFACRARTSPEPASMTLTVQNSSDFQVNIFAIPSTPSSRIRLGSIAGLSNGKLSLPQSALTAGGALRLLVDPVGSTVEWLSPTVNVSADVHPCLRVMSGVDGSLSGSTLYTNMGDGELCR